MSQNAMRFENKVAVVTGGGSGIGQATSLMLSREGAAVVVNDLKADSAAQTVKMIEAEGGVALALQGDVSDEAIVRANVEAALDKFGKIDVLINNAGRATVAPAESYTLWRTMIGVNLDGPFYWSQHTAVNSMIPRQSGAIVNVASLSGLTAHPMDVGYMAAKHGVVGLTKGLAVDWACYGIRVNAVCPGLTTTPIQKTISAQPFEGVYQRIPFGRAGQPEEQAHAILFLASDQASFITGAILNVDGGTLALKSLFPPRAMPSSQ